MSDLFWKQATKEYLPQLQERKKWSTAACNFIPGDIVLLVDDSAPRNSWIIGKVIQIFPDKKAHQVRIKAKTNFFLLDQSRKSFAGSRYLTFPLEIRSFGLVNINSDNEP